MKSTITIPYVPKSLNRQERMHWAKWHREKQQWIHDIFFLLREHGNTIPRGLTHIKIAEIKIFFKEIRTRDESNFEPMIIKPLADALVYAKIIPNDTAEFITRPGRVNIEIDRECPRTEITLEW